MDNALNMVRTGELSFAAFEKQTRPVWTALAINLLKRWPGPQAVEREDLIQELLLGAWLALPKWKAGKSPLRNFIVWQAMYSAKNWLHAQRGASKHGTRDKNKSRFEVSVGDVMHSDFAAYTFTEVPSVDSPQEYAMLCLETLHLATKLLRTENERAAFAAVVETGSVDLALVMLAQQGKQLRRRQVLNVVEQVALQLQE